MSAKDTTRSATPAATPATTPVSPASPGASSGAGGKTGGVEEIGGPKGPEPTRYGDWEQGGRCTDF
ncbi:MAG: DUF1674 domain-containing protein [Alphaproteobacteria bacterium]|nr:DUF1674 domain-containing protein [Alphaproteobacteria bacterium]MBF0128903.1 DUF1674 domain-containing protein [Alphaproteobacteria bacterium]